MKLLKKSDLSATQTTTWEDMRYSLLTQCRESGQNLKDVCPDDLNTFLVDIYNTYWHQHDSSLEYTFYWLFMSCFRSEINKLAGDNMDADNALDIIVSQSTEVATPEQVAIDNGTTTQEEIDAVEADDGFPTNDSPESYTDQISAGDLLTVVFVTSMAMTSRQEIKVVEVESPEIFTYKIGRKRTVYTFNVKAQKAFIFRGHDLDVRVDSDFGSFSGNACYNFTLYGFFSPTSLATWIWANCLTPITYGMKHSMVVKNYDDGDSPEGLVMFPNDEFHHAVIQRMIADGDVAQIHATTEEVPAPAEEETTDAIPEDLMAEIAAAAPEVKETPNKARTTTKKSSATTDTTYPEFDEHGQAVQAREDLIDALAACETHDDFEALLNSSEWENIGLLQLSSGRYTDNFRRKPACAIYKKNGKKAKVLFREMVNTFNAEDGEGAVLTEGNNLLAEVEDCTSWNAWKAKMPAAKVLISIRSNFEVSVDDIECQEPVINYTFVDGKKGGTYVKDLARYFVPVEVIAASDVTSEEE